MVATLARNPVRRDVLVDACPWRGVLDQPLNVWRCVFVRALALKDVAVPPATEVRAQFLRQCRQNRNIAVAFILGVGDVYLRRIESQVQVFDPEVNTLTHASAGIEQVSLVYVNTLMIQQVLAEPEWSGRLTTVDLRALSPLKWQHVNPYGTFTLDMKERLPLAQ